MLDDDVICLHHLSPEGDKPTTLDKMLQAISGKHALVIGFHCRNAKRSRGKEDWVDDKDLDTPLATALSVSTDVSTTFCVQFHP